MRYRVHGANMSRDIATMEHDMTYAFAKAFADPRLPPRLRERKRHAYARHVPDARGLVRGRWAEERRHPDARDRAYDTTRGSLAS